MSGISLWNRMGKQHNLSFKVLVMVKVGTISICCTHPQENILKKVTELN